MIVPFLTGMASDAADLHSLCFSDQPWPAEAFIALLASQSYGFGWVENKKLTGLIVARDAADETEILTFAVAPACRRKGIGTQLALALCAHCELQGISSLFLEVASNNPAAQSLYVGLGFQQVGERSGYYRGSAAPVDALVMLKKFERRCD
jgi:ribosomal-protein-alanine N-acetyltransferase